MSAQFTPGPEMLTPLDALRGLVAALNATTWSSWKTTAAFTPALVQAERVLAAERARDLNLLLMCALQTIDDEAEKDSTLSVTSPTWAAIVAARALLTEAAS